MRRLASLALVLGALALAVVLGGAKESSSSDKPKYKILFDNSFGLVEGGDFRVGGVKAGKTSKFAVKREKGRALAVVTAEINQPGFGDFRKDATCEIKPQSLIGEYYVDCQPGDAKEKLPQDGTGVVPVKRTASTIPADLVNNIMRRPYRERFRLIISELGTGLAGRPDDLQEVVKRAHPGLRETSKVLRILGDQNKIIEDFITDSDTVIEELEANKKDVVRFIEEAGDTAEISATRREELRRSFNKLPTFLGELEPTMARLGDLADEQTPLLTDLQRAAPHLDTFFTRLGPFAEASRPALRSLGKASLKGTAAFKEGAEEVDVLQKLAPDAKPTFKPLRQFLVTMDDRKRAIENDPRAKEGSPPAPDPTAIRGEGGFTGLEAIWNYAFWQTLSINGYDDISHILRIGVTVTECSPLDNEENPNSEKFKKCSQWLGPDLPGITSRDFTESPTAAKATPAKSIGEERAAGQPDAQALPGQRDISKPQVVLPPGIKQLLDELPRAERDRAAQRFSAGGGQASRRGGAGSDSQLLDFLLAPMRNRRGTASLVASPVLVGAVTVLISIIAVFIAYNANKGLPFVPTYDLKAELPSGGKLVKGNEVRSGGFRVGVVDEIRPKTVRSTASRRPSPW